MRPMTEVEQVEFMSEAKTAGLAVQQEIRNKIRHSDGDTAALFSQLGRLNGDLRVLEAELKRL